MDLNELIKSLKAHPEQRRIGMIASHVGIVRGTSRNGRDVTGIEVAYDHDKIKRIIDDVKAKQGIVEVLVDANEGGLKVGDDILTVAVAGEIRDDVFPALIEAVNRIKIEATRKKEFFD